MKYESYILSNFKKIKQISKLDKETIFNIEVVSSVLPFKTNNYVVDELIDWNDPLKDPLFILTFPQKEMLIDEDFNEIAELVKKEECKEKIKKVSNEIRKKLNPHPAGQLELNSPILNGVRLPGIQHKYRETVLFFPAQGQTCHAYCTFCFRWPQFVGIDEWKIANKEIENLKNYLKANPFVTDVLFTGGDPLVMKTKLLEAYIEPLLRDNLPNLRNIRIGSKVLAYWPYRFLTDSDADELLRLFERIVKSGKHLAFMAHFNHPRELETEAVKKAISRIKSTGAEIRSQSPVLKQINNDANLWADMLKKQVALGIIPYYMFIARDTGAQHYFAVTLEDAWNIFRKAYQQVSGICRTIRGPSMSCTPGKVQVLGVSEVEVNSTRQKVFVLRFLQGRNPDWAARPFFAEYNSKATWISDLKPAFGEEKFFFEEELEKNFNSKVKDVASTEF